MIDCLCTFSDEAVALESLGPILGDGGGLDPSRCIAGLTVTQGGATVAGFHVLVGMPDPPDALGALPQVWLMLDRRSGLPLWAASDTAGLVLSPLPAGANYTL